MSTWVEEQKRKEEERRQHLYVVPEDPLPPPEPGSMLDYALRYAAIGWHVFPVWGSENGKCRCGKADCGSPAKHPVEHLARRGQDSATTDPAIIRRWWTAMPEAGIAVHVRPSGLVAIDIDPRNGGLETLDQLELQNGPLHADVLQFTQGGGEHRVYSLPAGVEAGLPGKLGKGIDVKRNGYIVVEPTHGCKGQYNWEGSSDPLEGAIPGPLPDWLRSIAQQQAAAPATMPAVRFVTDEQVEELRSALAVIPSDDRDLWIRFLHALKPIGQDGFDLWDEWSQKSDKYDPVDLARKWHSAKPSGSLNYETIFYHAQELGWVNPMSGPPPVPAESVTVATPMPSTSTPAHLLDPPGILGEIAQWIAQTSRKPQPQFNVQAAIAFAATVMGRHYCTTQRNWPSLYLLNIGKSASGKEHAKWAIETLLEACGLERLIGPANYTSSAGVLSALGNQPSHITIVDEFGKTLEAASIKNNARAASALVTLMEAWGRCDGVLRPQGYSTFGMSAKDAERLEDRSVRNPALSLLGMTTPDTFFESIGSAAARDGFLNRFLIVESDIGRQVGQPARKIPVPDAIVEWAQQTHQHEGLADPDINATLSAVPKLIEIDAVADAMFQAFDAECVEQMDRYEEHDLSEMFGRANEIAMRLSLVLAVGCGQTSIRQEQAAWAIDYVRHYTARTVDRLIRTVADSEFEAVKKQVLDSLLRAGANGLTERELSKSSRRFRRLDVRGQRNVLESLRFLGDIQNVQITPTGGFRRPRNAWVAIDPDQAPTSADT